MTSIDHLKSICQQLNKKPPIENKLVLDNQHSDISPIKTNKPIENVKIGKNDLVAISNFVKVWTDLIEIEDIMDQFEDSEFDDLTMFEHENYLFNLGFFYVKVEPKCSASEFLGLISLIPLEHFALPGSKEVSYATLSQLFGKGSEKIVMQLMVLGDYFQFWQLINPFDKLKNTNENYRLLLAGLGGLTIRLMPDFIGQCLDLMRNMISLNEQQAKM